MYSFLAASCGTSFRRMGRNVFFFVLFFINDKQYAQTSLPFNLIAL